MSILEYVNRFLYLSQFGEHIIPTDHDQAKKFVEGLNDEYFKGIEVHEDATYERVFNRALELKAKIKVRKREREMQSETRKRPRFEGSNRGSRQQTYFTPGVSSGQRGDSQMSSRASRLGSQFRESTRSTPHGTR